MRRHLVTDELWGDVDPLLPRHREHPKGGRPWCDDRQALAGIIFVLKTGIQWEDLPLEFGCCGMTCWRRLRDWQRAGVWDRLHQLLLARLRGADQLDFSRAIIDSGSLRAVGGGEATGPNPTDRRKSGSKHHIIVDARGTPLAAKTTGANVHDCQALTPMVDAIPPVKGKVGRPRRRPDAVQGDRAYASKSNFAALKERRILPVIAKKDAPHGSGLGKTRWPVEGTLAWLRNFRRLRVRFDRRADIHMGFLTLAMGLITAGVIERLC